MSRETASDELARSCSEDSAADRRVEPMITSCTDSDDESVRIGQSTAEAAAATRLDILDERAVEDVTTFAVGRSQEQTSEELGESESNTLQGNFVVPRLLIETSSLSKTPPAPQPLSTLHRELIRSKRIQEAPVPPSLVRTTTTPPRPVQVVTTSSSSSGAASITPIDQAQHPELAQPKQIRDSAVPPSRVRTTPPPTPETPPSSEQVFLNYYPSGSTSSTPFVDAVPINVVSSLNQERRSNENESPQLATTCDEVREKKRWKRYLLAAVIAAIVIASVVAVPVALTSKNDEPTPAPSSPPTPIQDFKTTYELQSAVDAYLDNNGSDTTVAKTYGWPINEWQVKRISNFVQLFAPERNPKAALFDEPLHSWNVSRATKMREMFHSALMFNQDVSMWEVSRVTDMTDMFHGASAFNQDLCRWQSILVSGTVQVQGMFFGTSCAVEKDPTLTASSDAPGGHFCALCTDYSQDAFSPPPTPRRKQTEAPSPSQTPSATQVPTPMPTQSPTQTLTRLPSKCFETKDELRDAVYQYLVNSSDMTSVAYDYGWPINNWCVSQITDFSALFGKRNNASANFNERIDLWDVSNAVDMGQMFREAEQFNQNLNAWNTSRVTDMSNMFRKASSFNGRVSSWDTSKVEKMGGMFMNAKSFSQDISQWDVSGVKEMQDMFAQARKFAGNLAAWNVSSVIDMARTFHGCLAFNSDLSAWDVRKVDDMHGMFRYAGNFRRNLCSWGPQLQGRNVAVTNMFNKSGCPTTVTPNLTSSPPGPFCFVCEQ